MAPKLQKFQPMEVKPVVVDTPKAELHLIEFLFLNMDFNYKKSVPSKNKITFHLPDIK